MEWISALEDLLIPLAGIGMVTLLGLGVYRIVHRVMDRRAAPGMADELDQVRGALADLQDDVQAMQHESTRQIGELHERLDFAERLLAERTDRRIPESVSTPT